MLSFHLIGATFLKKSSGLLELLIKQAPEENLFFLIDEPNGQLENQIELYENSRKTQEQTTEIEF